jgi:sialate O-acetylesterase
MKANIRQWTLIALLFTTTPIITMGQIRLPQLIGDGMVLQRDCPIKIWGWASPGEIVDLNFNNANYQALTDRNGNWEIHLPPFNAGGPYTMTLRAGNTVQIHNILVGDVWLCSGQSNMETPIARVMTLFGDEINGYSNSEIRYVKIPSAYNFHEPQSDVMPCSWMELTPETVQNFSAVAYFFAKEMYEETGVPIGLINSSVGGSPVEAWISEEALRPFPAFLNDKRICESDEFVADMIRFASLLDQRWQTILNEQDKGLNETIKWYATDKDDSTWETTDLFDNRWGRKEFHPVNGVFWFRKDIEIPDGLEKQDAILYMGRIVDADSVYVNGKFVGATGYQYPPRNYPVPKGILQAGKNTIAVRLVSRSGFPEFVKDKPYKLVLGRREIDLKGEWKQKIGAGMPAVSDGGINFQYKPVGLYNAMIAPLSNHAIKGVLWYQGESNTGRYGEYYNLMASLIADWRNLWNNADLPFLIVQLPNFMEPALIQQQSDWAELRNVQLKLSRTVPNTGLAVAIDLGEWNDVHPLNKKDVGKRLALQALKWAYGKKIISGGPLYQSHEIAGNKIILSFENGTNDLLPVNKLKGFAIAGDDGIFEPAEASIDGGQVIVWNNDIPQPKKVRYAWANNPAEANLKNKSGLPASPFQTE